MAEGGLALATVISAVLKLGLLAWLLIRRSAHLAWREVGATTGRTLLAAGAMGLATWATMHWAVPALPLAGRWLDLARLLGGIGVGTAVFVAAARLLKMSELGDLLGGGERIPPDGPKAPADLP
jgi:putative peptidoglycan lipid II flippase